MEAAFYTAEDRFLQILLSGKTCQLCVVFIELIPYNLDQIAAVMTPLSRFSLSSTGMESSE